jgi:uridine kinase
LRIESIIQLIDQTPAANTLNTKVIAIDGCGGAGKSTLAQILSDRMGNSPIVPTDDFASWGNPFEWAPRFLEEDLLPLARGESIQYQRSDWDPPHLVETIEVPLSGLLIIEGVGSSRLSFAPYISFAIWIETPRVERLKRGFERDGVGMLDEWNKWMAEEEIYVAGEKPQERADAVLSGESPLPD